MQTGSPPSFAPPFAPERFERVRLLGRGGMGEVYLAHDRQLGRLVALKFLRTDDPDLENRLLLEARCQAAIRHPNVVPIHEVGLLQGRPCIVMAFIDGTDFWEARSHLPLEGRVSLVAQACRGVHAAHRVGLVHGDLKPQNIMVEWMEGSGWRAHVTDFGLARSQGAGPDDERDAPKGTFAYMSPEHLLGQSLLDARSDVYSLGAILFSTLTEHPPFEESPSPPLSDLSASCSEPRLLGARGELQQRDTQALLDLAMRRFRVDPPWVRQLNPAIPRDLETIARHALEPEPHRRYPTAQALAEDLERFLAGEPILARPPSFGYRLARHAARNRALAWLSAISFVGLLLCLAAFGLMSRRAKVQALLAQQYATEAQQIEQHVRLGHMLPSHDRRPHLQWAQGRMALLREAATRHGAIAEGPYAFLAGATHLLLDHPEAAKIELERAWSLGFRTPFAAQILGEATLEARQRELSEAHIAGASAPDPALGFLRQARRSDVPNPLLEARIALLEGREDEAIASCERALSMTPWAYEAHLQIGMVWVNRLGKASYPNGTRQVLGKALAQFDAAIRLAPSDPKPILAKSMAMRLLSRRRVQVDGFCDPAALQEALKLCDEAERLDPDYSNTYAERSLLRCVLLLYTKVGKRSGWVDHEVSQMVEDGHRAVRLEPQGLGGVSALGWAIYTRARIASQHARATCAGTLDQSVSELRRLIQSYPRVATLHIALAYSLGTRSDLDHETGGDPRPMLREMILAIREAQNLFPQRQVAQGERTLSATELGERLLALAELETAYGDYPAARRCALEGKGLLEHLVALNQPPPRSLQSLVWSHLLLAHLDIWEGSDPHAAMAAAKALVDRHGRPRGNTRFIVPRQMPFHEHLLLAEVATRRGDDPRPFLRACFQEAKNHLAKHPEDHSATYAALEATLEEVLYALPRTLDAHAAAENGRWAASRVRDLERRSRPLEPASDAPCVGGILFQLAHSGRRPSASDAATAYHAIRRVFERNAPLASYLRRDPRWWQILEQWAAGRASGREVDLCADAS